jgi:spore coat polysaccharide biosynthesis protein SpsF (cytidylyltransferase family)/aryl-alcohol dehydrogenase-like predicted oxidoreductase
LKTMVVIQARTTSSRLPAKVLLPVTGYPLVVLAAKRAANTGRDVIVATSDEESDDYLAEVLRSCGIKCFRGSLQNVLLRFVLALKDLSDETIVFRLTADNVLPDGYLIDEVESDFITRGVEYLVCNGINSGLPYGLSVEVTRLKHLRDALDDDPIENDKEHVTTAVIRKFGLTYFDKYLAHSMGNFRCTVDCLDDYLLIADIFRSVKDPVAENSLSLIERLKKSHNQPILTKPANKLVFGAVQLGLDYGITNTQGMPSSELTEKLLKTAIVNGVERIDTANAYGSSEIAIGKALGLGWKSRVSVITKLAPLNEMPNNLVPEACAAFVDASIYRSMARLGISRIDTLLLHRASHLTNYHGCVWNRLLFHKKIGTVGAIGVSVQSPEELLLSLDFTEIDHIQMPYNIFDWRWDGLIERIYKVKAERKLVIHLRSIYLQGLLLVRDELFWNKANLSNTSEIFNWLDRSVSGLARNSVEDLCVAYVNGLDWVDGIVIGMETVEQLIENLRLVDRPPLNACERENLVKSRPVLSESVLNPSLWKQT